MVSASISTRLSVYQLCEQRTLRIFPCFFFHLDKFFFRHFSKYIDLKIRKFFTVNIWENFNYFYEISVFSDMARIAERCVTCHVIFIAYNLNYNNSRPMSLREFLQLWKICNNHLPWLHNIRNLKNHFASAWLSRNVFFCSLKHRYQWIITAINRYRFLVTHDSGGWKSLREFMRLRDSAKLPYISLCNTRRSWCHTKSFLLLNKCSLTEKACLDTDLSWFVFKMSFLMVPGTVR